VSGRTVAVLDRTLTGLARQPRRQPSRSVTRDADKPGLFAAIRRDGQDGHSIRALAARHQVHRRTIRQALADPAPPPRRQMPLRRHALDRLHEPIAAMLALAPTGPRPAARRYTDEDIQRSHAARRAKDAAIRGDAGNGMSGRAIERKHHVGRRTIVKALASADPPERKKIHREPTALDGLHWHIDAMIAANPQITIAAIWERLAYEHGTAVAYPTLRTYVASGRGQGQTGQDQLR
jgi:transposase